MQHPSNAFTLSNLKKNLSYNFILSFSQLVFPLVSIPYVSRILDPEGIGKVSFIDSFTLYFIALAEFGIASYAIREVAKKKNDPQALSPLVSELLWLHILTSCGTLVVYIACVALVWYRIGDTRLLLFSLSFFLTSFFSCEWYYMGVEKFRFIAIRSIAVRLLGVASLFLLVHQRSDHYLYYGIMAVSGIITIGWNFFYMMKQITLRFRWQNIRRHIGPVFVLFQMTIFLSASIWLDNVLLGILSSAAALGFYTFAIKLVRIAGALITDMLYVLYPRMVTLLHQEDHEQFKAVNLMSVRIVIALAVPLAAGLFLLAEPFTAFYLGPKFERVSTHIKILSVYPLLKAYTLNLNKQILLPYHNDRVVVRGLAAGFATLVILMLSLCPFLHDMGASISIVLSECVTLLYFAIFIRKKHAGTHIFDASGFVQAVAGSVIFFPLAYLIYRLPLSPLYHITLVIGACVIVYFMIQSLIFRNRIFLQAYHFVRGLV